MLSNFIDFKHLDSLRSITEVGNKNNYFFWGCTHFSKEIIKNSPEL